MGETKEEIWITLPAIIHDGNSDMLNEMGISTEGDIAPMAFKSEDVIVMHPDINEGDKRTVIMFFNGLGMKIAMEFAEVFDIVKNARKTGRDYTWKPSTEQS